MQYENGKTTVMDGEVVYVHIIQKYFTPELAFWDTEENLEKLRKHAWEMEASLLWKKGPDVNAPDQYGKMQSIYEKDAQLIVVFMLSPHCEHCQKQAPEIEKAVSEVERQRLDLRDFSHTTDEEWQASPKAIPFQFYQCI
ncbi:MAG: hypothetical protein R2792_16815 [Saprospiraceae bacterium]